MALWGQGDPRWLVEDRPDATNVNNWHWTEKDASQWSKDKLSELLVGLKIEDDVASCDITEMNKCEGYAFVNNRKGKLICFYEWAIELKWNGKLKEDGDCSTCSGSFEVLNLSEEHDIKDVDITVNLDSVSSESECVKGILREKGIEIIRKKLFAYLNTLKEEFSKGLILPTKEDTTISSGKPKEAESKSKTNVTESKPVHTSLKNRTVETCEVKSTENFKCTAEEFFRALTVKEMVRAFTLGDCIVEPVVGGKFELYGGNVYGNFTELVPNKIIKQKWRNKSWPDGIFSDVTIEINEKSDSTEVRLHQRGVPKNEMEQTLQGWKRYYWQSIKKVFGFGAMLF